MSDAPKTAAEAPTEPVSLYAGVRAEFIRRGTTLSAWCDRHGVTRQNAERALRGQRKSAAAEALRRRIAEAVGLTP